MSFHYYKIATSYFPSVSLAGSVQITPPYVHYRRQAREYILYYILEGEMFLEETGKNQTFSYHLTPGDFLILDPDFEHYGTKTSSCTYYFIHFSHDGFQHAHEDAEHLKEILKNRRFSSFSRDKKQREESLYLPKYYHMPPSSQIHLKNCLALIKTAFMESLECHGLKSACLFYDFLIECSRTFAEDMLSGNVSAASTSSVIIHKILNYFQEHYMDDISGDSISELFHCNFDYINRRFRQATGKTIFYYLNEVRITMAKQFLQSGYYTISETADLTGFHDVYYFSKVFKKYTGITPGKYLSS